MTNEPIENPPADAPDDDAPPAVERPADNDGVAEWRAYAEHLGLTGLEKATKAKVVKAVDAIGSGAAPSADVGLTTDHGHEASPRPFGHMHLYRPTDEYGAKVWPDEPATDGTALYRIVATTPDFDRVVHHPAIPSSSGIGRHLTAEQINTTLGQMADATN